MRRSVLALAALAASLAPMLASASPASARVSWRTTWAADFPADRAADGSFNVIAQSSPVLAMTGGTDARPSPEAVVGSRNGDLLAFDIATGSSRVLYRSTIPIDAPPSAAPIGPGQRDVVFFGRGSRAVSCRAADGSWGGYSAVSATGSLLWAKRAFNPPGVPCRSNGVMGGMSLFDRGGKLRALGMSLGQAEWGFTAASGDALSGWSPWFQADSSISTPALVWDSGPTQPPLIVEGGDSTAGLAYGGAYRNGGHVRVISPKGNGGVPGFGGQRCAYDTYAGGGQIVESSPAVGPFLPAGAIGIASGMGYFPSYAGPTNKVFVLGLDCKRVWSATTDFETSSPILADVDGDGRLDVVVGTQDVSQHGQTANGSVYAFDAATGRLLWSHATGAVIGQPVAADLRGSGHADIVVATVGGLGLQVLDGTSGSLLKSSSEMVSQSTPLLTADRDGSIGITVAGYHSISVGVLGSTVRHWSYPGSSSADLSRPLTTWAEFHHDPRLSGNAAGFPQPAG